MLNQLSVDPFQSRSMPGHGNESVLVTPMDDICREWAGGVWPYHCFLIVHCLLIPLTMVSSWICSRKWELRAICYSGSNPTIGTKSWEDHWENAFQPLSNYVMGCHRTSCFCGTATHTHTHTSPFGWHSIACLTWVWQQHPLPQM